MGILLFGLKNDPHREKGSLAEKFILSQHNEEAQQLRRIGDLSLLIAGIWWQSLLRK